MTGHAPDPESDAAFTAPSDTGTSAGESAPADGAGATENAVAPERSDEGGAAGETPLSEVPDEVRLRAGIEAILFLADEPVDARTLAGVLELPVSAVEQTIEELANEYDQAPRGIEVRQAAGGWRLYTSPLARPMIERWAVAGRTGRLTQAALETLAVIAYKQPISRQQIGDIRGVNADASVRTLVARGLVQEVARHEGPGQAVLYGTTTTFLERLGLDSLDDLPPLTEYLLESPAPDEPELRALREVRRRLADAGGPTERQGGEDRGESPEDEELLPAPSQERRRGDDESGMQELTDELDRVARGAVQRLRQAVAADARANGEPDPSGPGEPDTPAKRDPGAREPGEPDPGSLAEREADASEVDDDG